MGDRVLFNPLIEVKADDLYTPEVREWSLEKYKLVGSYCDIFTSGMKNKWGKLVYIDLFAGAGYAKVIEKNKIYKNSAFIAMSTPNTFAKYILCEQDPERFNALKARVERDFNHLDVTLLHCDSNNNTRQIKQAMPVYMKGSTVLSFCFVDPFSLNLKFSTIKDLGDKFVDFLILQALHMDANRNFVKYINEQSNTISDYLGFQDWRKDFESDGVLNNKDFVKFLSDSYQKQMNLLGYQTTKHAHPIRSSSRNLPLYYLSFFSRHLRGEEFFTKVKSRIKPQLGLDLNFDEI